jgi:hypothetical protein
MKCLAVPPGKVRRRAEIDDDSCAWAPIAAAPTGVDHVIVPRDACGE